MSAPFEKATQICKKNAKTTDAVIKNYADRASMENYSSLVFSLRTYCENPLPFNKLNCKQLEEQIAVIENAQKKRQNPLGGSK